MNDAPFILCIDWPEGLGNGTGFPSFRTAKPPTCSLVLYEVHLG